MKRFFQLMAVAVIAFGAVGCGGDDDDDDNPAVPVPPGVQEDGTTAANFTCNAIADPFTGGVGSVTMTWTVSAPNVSGGADPVTAAQVQQIDADDLSTIGSQSGDTIVDGTTTLDVDANARVALRMTGPTGFITTTYFNQVTPPPGTGADGVLLIPESIYGAFIGLAGFQPSDLAGTGQITGAVVDCDSELIANAVITVTGITPAAIVYFGETGTPDKNATHTPSNGQFLIVGVPPTTSTFLIEASIYTGADAEGLPDTLGSNARAQSIADEISIAIVSPTFN